MQHKATITVAGKQYPVAPLSARIIKAHRGALNNIMSSSAEAQAADVLTRIVEVAEVLHASILAADPQAGVSLEEVEGAVTMANLHEVTEIFMRANGLVRSGEALPVAASQERDSKTSTST